MKKGKNITVKRWVLGSLIAGAMLLGILAMFGTSAAFNYTSTDTYCQSCHIHPKADESWKLSTHVNNQSGVRVHCVECHLPPSHTIAYYVQKTSTGLRDLYSYYTKDSASINWEAKAELDYAVKHVYNESCKECHTNIFPAKLSDDGIIAHLYYDEKEKELDLQCISCHLNVGHYNPNAKHEKMSGIPNQSANKEKFAEATTISSFSNFKEQVPGTAIAFNMIAIPGGSFAMGSSEKESFRKEDEGPVRKVTLSPFFMAEIEVTWDMFWAFYAETLSEGRISPSIIYANNAKAITAWEAQRKGEPYNELDGVSGPTPPFGLPDQGWGGTDRPAITMTHYAAEMLCLWLSKKTGKTYRLPTEAEWEYAARGGKETPYFFEGDPKKYSDNTFWNNIFGADTTRINSYVIYEKNSSNKTQEPKAVHANPYGLKNMLGNVMEYCSDWYAPDAYSQTDSEVTNPKGPTSGTEHVVRGGWYKSTAEEVRCATRGMTKNEAWLKTDPQQPKSIWWYSDMKGIGIRVVCDVPTTINK